MIEFVMVVLAAVALLGAVFGVLLFKAIRYRRYEVRADPARFPSVETQADALALADDLLGRMTLREKLDQLSGDIPFLRFGFRYAVGLLSRFGVPHMYSGRNARLGIPPLAFSDGPRGVNVGTGRTAFPVTMARGASWDPALEERVGRAMGRELRAIGANYSGAVCVNLLRHPGWGRAQETYGEDSFHLGALGVALTRGIQHHNVMACVKHFALNSIECARFYVDVQVDERRLREVYLPHFERILREGEAASVMSAYNRFRGEYCGHSRALLTEVLRDQWGFEGFVTSDWLHGVRDGVAGIRAGMDVEMPARQRYGRPLLRALRDGTISEFEIEQCARRVLATRMRFALAPDPETYEPAVICCDEHVALAREVAEQSAVLLKNEGVLPFEAKSLGRLAVIGALADRENTGDLGSSHVRAPHVVTPAAGLRGYLDRSGTEVVVDPGEDLQHAAALAAESDAVVLVVGFTSDDEGEYFVMNPDSREGAWRPSFFGGGGDRSDLRLRPEDRELIGAVAAANPKTVVVAVVGSAFEVREWIDDVPALLLPFYSGMEGGHALARLLFGDVSPSGKLPFTMASDSQDLPPFEPFGEVADYGDDHGYLRFDKQRLPVAFPFGYGLSYTRFAYDELKVDEVVVEEGTLRVSVRLRNEGARVGAEVVQLYVGFPNARVERPVKLLRGFRKVWLAAGEEREVRFDLPVSELAYYAPETGRWTVEAVAHTVLVGGSSREDDLLRADVEIRRG